MSLLQTDGKPDVQSREGAFDVLNAVEVPGIIGQHLDRRTVALQRHPMILLEIINVEILQ